MRSTNFPSHHLASLNQQSNIYSSRHFNVSYDKRTMTQKLRFLTKIITAVVVLFLLHPFARDGLPACVYLRLAIENKIIEFMSIKILNHFFDAINFRCAGLLLLVLQLLFFVWQTSFPHKEVAINLSMTIKCANWFDADADTDADPYVRI